MTMSAVNTSCKPYKVHHSLPSICLWIT